MHGLVSQNLVGDPQDALGLVMPGLNRHDYAGAYWPTGTTTVLDEPTLAWLESRLHLVELGPRRSEQLGIGQHVQHAAGEHLGTRYLPLVRDRQRRRHPG